MSYFDNLKISKIPLVYTVKICGITRQSIGGPWLTQILGQRKLVQIKFVLVKFLGRAIQEMVYEFLKFRASEIYTCEISVSQGPPCTLYT